MARVIGNNASSTAEIIEFALSDGSLAYDVEISNGYHTLRFSTPSKEDAQALLDALDNHTI